MHLFLLYIDPGIGNLALQVIIAGFAAFMMFFRNGFKQLFFRSYKNDSKKDNSKIPD